jgi:hypothetical protein
MLDPSHNLTGEFNGPLALVLDGSADPTRSHAINGLLYAVASPHRPPRRSTDLIRLLGASELLRYARSHPPGGAKSALQTGHTPRHLTGRQNAVEAHVEVYASGNALEEFWYSNAPDSLLPHLSPTAGVLGKGCVDPLARLAGRPARPAHSPYREVQLLIDGRLAGVIVPFPVIYVRHCMHDSAKHCTSTLRQVASSPLPGGVCSPSGLACHALRRPQAYRGIRNLRRADPHPRRHALPAATVR